MLAGVATRRPVDVTDRVGVEGTATSQSAVSRRFKAATEAAMSELLARDLSSLETAVLLVDVLNVGIIRRLLPHSSQSGWQMVVNSGQPRVGRNAVPAARIPDQT